MKPKNKLRRQAAYLSIRKAKEAAKRDERFKRKREEQKNESLREDRLARNVPQTIESKRTWDEGVGDEEDVLGWAVDVERLAKKRKLEQEAAEQAEQDEEECVLAKLKKRDAENVSDDESGEDEERDSMLDSDSEDDSDGSGSDSGRGRSKSKSKQAPPKRAASPAASTATNLELSPEFLVCSLTAKTLELVLIFDVVHRNKSSPHSSAHLKPLRFSSPPR
jgi:ribosome production factor 1